MSNTNEDSRKQITTIKYRKTGENSRLGIASSNLAQRQSDFIAPEFKEFFGTVIWIKEWDGGTSELAVHIGSGIIITRWRGRGIIEGSIIALDLKAKDRKYHTQNIRTVG